MTLAATKSGGEITLQLTHTPDHEDGPSKTAMDPLTGLHVHFIGIGGSGMNGLAQMLIQSRAIVSGTDRTRSMATEKLSALGAHIDYVHGAAALPPECDLVVHSAAIKADHPEMLEAARRGLKILKYAQLLGHMMSSRQGIAIAGTHGKSTTTAMTAYALTQAAMDPSFVVGANCRQLQGSAHGGGGHLFVVEACEYDRSFLNLHPHIAAILNIEEDHLDYYHDIEEIIAAFAQLLRQVDPAGTIITQAQDEHCLAAARAAGVQIETYGIETPACWQAVNLATDHGRQSFDVLQNNRPMGRLTTRLAGRHNVGNALVTAAIGVHCGAKWQAVADGIANFGGVDRRSEFLGQRGGINFVDDYGHHPTEIRATLQALRDHYAPRRLICVFQPHQHSRTRFLLNDFARSFAHADLTIVPDIYFVRDSELDRQAVNAAMLVDRIRANGRQARYIPDFPGILNYLQGQLQPGDLVVSMGAGPVWEITHELVRRL